MKTRKQLIDELIDGMINDAKMYQGKTLKKSDFSAPCHGDDLLLLTKDERGLYGGHWYKFVGKDALKVEEYNFVEGKTKEECYDILLHECK